MSSYRTVRTRLRYMSELLDRHRAVLPNWMALYYEHPLELVSGSGSRVTDAAGRTYLDFFCGILTNMLGYDLLTDAEYIAACTADLRHLLPAGAARQVACLIAEPVQGVGGFTMPPDGLFGEYKKVLDEHGILVISDEVQTGWGRTGDHFWGIGAHGITPDMITFAKGLGNGFAIGGVIARGDLMDGLPGNGIST